MNEQPFKVPSRKPLNVMLWIFLILLSITLFVGAIRETEFQRWMIICSFFLMVVIGYKIVDYLHRRLIIIFMNDLYSVLIRYPRWIYIQGGIFKLDKEMFEMHELNYRKYILLRQVDFQQVAIEVKRRK